MKFIEEKLEEVFIELLGKQGYDYVPGLETIRNTDEVIIEKYLEGFLQSRYGSESITANEIQQIILRLKSYPSSDLYETNKSIMKMVSDGFILKREDRKNSPG